LANNKIQVKRTNIAGRTANVTSAGNAQYIDAGEFALNMADGILYTSNGTALITVGANQVNQRITNSLNLDQNKPITFKTVNTAASVSFIQQNDDNFVFYTTNTSYGQRAVWSIFANNNTANLKIAVQTTFNGNLDFNVVAVYANGSPGTSGQVLTTNGSSTYWSTVSGGGGSVNVDAQYVWTNTQTFNANITFGNNISVADTKALFFNGMSDANWKIGRNTGGTSKFFYTGNTVDIIAANSATEGIAFGFTGNTYLETGYAGTFTRLPLYVGNSTQNVTTTNTTILVQANTTVNLTHTASLVRVSNSTATSNLTAIGLVAGANVVANTTALRVGNTTLTTTNAVFGGTIAANGGIGSAGQALISGAGANAYWATIGNGTVTSVGSGNGLTGGPITTSGSLSVLANNGITANSTGTFVTQGSGIAVNSTGVHVLANTGIVANSTGTFVNATYIGTLSANSATFLGAANNFGNSTGIFTNGVVNALSYSIGTTFTVNSTSLVYNQANVVIGNTVARGTLDAYTGSGQGTIVFGTGAVTYPTTPTALNGIVSKGATSDGRLMVQDGNGRLNDYWNAYSDAGGYKYIVANEPAARHQISIDATTNGAVFGWLSAPSSTAGAALTWTALGYLYTNNYVWFSPRGNSADFFISAGGNTGIGTTSPNAKLQVTGTANVSGNVAIAGITTLSTNVVLGTTTITANGGVGTAGQVLTSGATGNVYWASAAGGGYYKGGTSAVGTLAAGGQNIFRVNANVLNTSTTLVAGENAQATGPLSVASGITLTIESGARVSIV
jgi:trimeric autotransporter adhesin